MRYNVFLTSKFRKDIDRLKRRNKYNHVLIQEVLAKIANGERLPAKYRDHILKGRDYSGVHECHITPDLLLVYKINNDDLVLILLRAGTHSDLF